LGSRRSDLHGLEEASEAYPREASDEAPPRRSAVNLSQTVQVISGRGEAIYAAKYKADFEARYHGQYVAIDLVSEEATVAPTPERALSEAHRRAPQNLVHLIQVGSQAAFRLSTPSRGSADGDWVHSEG
jgi:hypothetical protein